MAKYDFKKIIQWLTQILRCPVCGFRYNLEQTKVIDAAAEAKAAINNNLLVHADCERCKSSVVFSIAVDGPEILTVCMVTDLTSYDTSKFKNATPITTDEVLATHQFLNDFDGDFKSALRAK